MPTILSGEDLPVEIQGGDNTQSILLIKNKAGTPVLEVKGDGTGIAPGGGGLVLDSSPGTSKNSDAVNAIPADGNNHNETPTITAPPVWLDAGGNIILPGLYLIYTSIAQDAGFTASAGLLVAINSPFNAQHVFSVDEMIFNGRIQAPDIAALELADLPYALTAGVKCGVDVTGTLALHIIVSRLAH